MSKGHNEGGAAKVWTIPQADQPIVERGPNRRRNTGGTRIVAPGTADSPAGIEVVRRADRRIGPAAPTAVPRDRSEIANRVVNVVLASLALVALSPVIIVVAIAVKLTSKGPGITGWAQINHSYDTSIDDVRAKIRYDLEYLERQCLAEDLKIMMKTVPVMLFRRSGW